MASSDDEESPALLPIRGADDEGTASDDALGMFRRFIFAYNELDVIPAFLDQWAMENLTGPEWCQAMRLFGFDLPVVGSAWTGKLRTWQHREVRLPIIQAACMPPNRLLTPCEVRLIPGLARLATGDQWQHVSTRVRGNERVICVRAPMRMRATHPRQAT